MFSFFAQMSLRFSLDRFKATDRFPPPSLSLFLSLSLSFFLSFFLSSFSSSCAIDLLPALTFNWLLQLYLVWFDGCDRHHLSKRPWFIDSILLGFMLDLFPCFHVSSVLAGWLAPRVLIRIISRLICLDCWLGSFYWIPDRFCIRSQFSANRVGSIPFWPAQGWKISSFFTTLNRLLSPWFEFLS